MSFTLLQFFLYAYLPFNCDEIIDEYFIDLNFAKSTRKLLQVFPFQTTILEYYFYK